MNTDGHRWGAEGGEIDDELNRLSERVIGAAFEVANVLGTGFLEKVYEGALCRELQMQGLAVARQQALDVMYKGAAVGRYVADLVVADRLLVELKCCETLGPPHLAQCLNYLRATEMRLGLLLNFQHPRIQVKRVAF